ncbi:hypothetical protein [Aureimonas sp. Leaf454]|uniref:hypothetical protein n=1 Tax=Aureimonas sp. Leaf454 TaxID=1736381 RepID=UPI000A99EC24|nr:hypothetical protein [Aureimonas sp. Leaf454]
MADRFEIQAAGRGRWSIVDRETADIASYRNWLMAGIGLDEADAVAALLNENCRLSHALKGADRSRSLLQPASS